MTLGSELVKWSALGKQAIVALIGAVGVVGAFGLFVIGLARYETAGRRAGPGPPPPPSRFLRWGACYAWRGRGWHHRADPEELSGQGMRLV